MNLGVNFLDIVTCIYIYHSIPLLLNHLDK